MKGQHTRLALCVLTIVSLAIRAQAQCQYELTIIQAGPPNCDPLPPSPTFGNGINESAQVVGFYRVCALGGNEAFLWDGGPDAITLTRPPSISSASANDINDAGLIVGAIGLAGIGTRAFLHDGNGFLNLGTLPRGTFSRAFAINSLEQIVGWWGNTVVGDPARAVFLWQEGEMTDLGAQLGTPNSEANDINDAGQIVGWMGMSSSEGGEAFIWDDGQITPLGQVGGSYFTNAEAINNVAQVVGRATTGKFPVTGTRAFLWDNGQMTDLGIFPGAERSAARDINDAGQIVGQAWSLDPRGIDAGLIWHDGTMIDLNALMPDGTGVHVRSATAINNHGQITGYGVVNVDDLVGVLLTPIRPPGDLDGDCHVGIDDFLMLLALWGPCEDPCPPSCTADLDGDCNVGIVDFLLLLANWG